MTMPDSKALHVIVVEDEMLLVMDLEGTIEAAGHWMSGSAPSVRRLEELRRDLPVDLAFVDLQLAEGSSGFEAADYIRDVWPEALIIFVTANARKLLPDIEKGHGVIEKPYSHRVISAALGFLHQGIRTPPPTVLAPRGLIMNAALEKAIKLP